MNGLPRSWFLFMVNHLSVVHVFVRCPCVCPLSMCLSVVHVSICGNSSPVASSGMNATPTRAQEAADVKDTLEEFTSGEVVDVVCCCLLLLLLFTVCFC